jgi:hypothetical protein
MTPSNQMKRQHEESKRLLEMNAAWDRMAAAAISKDKEGFNRARSEFWDCAPQQEKAA